MYILNKVSPFPKLLFSVLPFWSLYDCSCPGSISCSSLTSDQSPSSSSLSIAVTVVLVTADPLGGWELEENKGLVCSGLDLLDLTWTGDLAPWCFCGWSSSSSDSSSELKGGVLQHSHQNTLYFQSSKYFHKITAIQKIFLSTLSTKMVL